MQVVLMLEKKDDRLALRLPQGTAKKIRRTSQRDTRKFADQTLYFILKGIEADEAERSKGSVGKPGPQKFTNVAGEEVA